MTNETQKKLKVKLPERVVVSLGKDSNFPYMHVFDISITGGDTKSELPNFGCLFGLSTERVEYYGNTYKKIDEVAYIEKLTGNRAERYRIDVKRSGFSYEGKTVAIKKLTYVKTSPARFLETHLLQEAGTKLERILK